MSENKKQSPFSACLTHDFHKNGSYRILLLPSCNADYANRHTLASAIDAKLDAAQPDSCSLSEMSREISPMQKHCTRFLRICLHRCSRANSPGHMYSATETVPVSPRIW